MFGHNFFNDLMKKYVVFFGTVFNDIRIERVDSSDVKAQDIRVPLQYGPRQAFIARINENPDHLKPVSTMLPRMTFELTGMRYAQARKLPTTNKNFSTAIGNPRVLQSQYVPVPYDLQFSLNIFCRSAEDANRIVEQILPFFTPSYTATLNLIPAMGLKMDVPLTLKSTALHDNYEGPIANRRFIVWQLDFEMNAWFYGPVEKIRMIKTVIANLFTDLINERVITIDTLSNTAFNAGDMIYQGNSTVNNAIGVVTRANSSVLVVNTIDGEFLGNRQIRSTETKAWANVTGVTISSTPNETITVVPGLTANGLPTTNSSLTVAPHTIQPTDDYAFITTYSNNDS